MSSWNFVNVAGENVKSYHHFGTKFWQLLVKVKIHFSFNSTFAFCVGKIKAFNRWL